MNLREIVFGLIAPYDCLSCGDEGRLICDYCWPMLILMPKKDLTIKGVHQTISVTQYRGLAKALVRSMKIDAQRQACVLIARAMQESAPEISNVCVTHVPTSTARVRERGFDHGRLIAQEFARLRRLPYRSLLVRYGRVKQAGASKIQRAQQIKGIYQAKPGSIPQCPIVLIDDVTTTGATLTEVANVLNLAGAKSIHVLVFGHAI